MLSEKIYITETVPDNDRDGEPCIWNINGKLYSSPKTFRKLKEQYGVKETKKQ